jgi:hypothetical protein
MRSAVVILLLMYASVAGATSFPEFPFCPLGGPTGWMNRITGYDDYDGYDRYNRYDRYPPPGYYPSPYYQPDWRYSTQPGTQCDPSRHTCFRR